MDSQLREALAAELQVTQEQLTSDALMESFGLWDSTTRLVVMVLLGDALGTSIEPVEIARVKTFGDIEALVRAKRG